MARITHGPLKKNFLTGVPVQGGRDYAHALYVSKLVTSDTRFTCASVNSCGACWCAREERGPCSTCTVTLDTWLPCNSGEVRCCARVTHTYKVLPGCAPPWQTLSIGTLHTHTHTHTRVHVQSPCTTAHTRLQNTVSLQYDYEIRKQSFGLCLMGPE